MDASPRTHADYLLYTVHYLLCTVPGRVAQSVGHLTRKSGALGSIPGPATYPVRQHTFVSPSAFSSYCQLLAKVCARSTG